MNLNFCQTEKFKKTLFEHSWQEFPVCHWRRVPVCLPGEHLRGSSLEFSSLVADREAIHRGCVWFVGLQL